ncbi:hypothetical protein RRF57_013147 [Xylaria bambusicola]|uniref:Uncharacterized protein n=1 Tax=Xylaria bambusicola TaxID=326684 RepID=A0AAN7V1C7_9PEZI
MSSERDDTLVLVAVLIPSIRGCTSEAVDDLRPSRRAGTLELAALLKPSIRGCMFELVAEVLVVSHRATTLELLVEFVVSTRADTSEFLPGANASAREDTLGVVAAGFILSKRDGALWFDIEFAPSVRQSIVIPSMG